MPAPSLIGVSIPRAEGVDKVAGRTTYASDISLPGMLWGKVLHSPYPHARIRSIDVTGAWQVPGVRAVVTGKDIPDHYQGKVIRDMPVLCWDKVRFVGDRVAAVAADTPEAADEALTRIVVDYEVLPAVFDPLKALDPSTPVIHENAERYAGMPKQWLATDLHNGLTRLSFGKGDVAAGFAKADLVLEHTFHVPARIQGYLEPFASLLHIDETGRVQIWASSKAPFRVRGQVSAATGVPEDRIKVNVVSIGADFGGKGDSRDVSISYFLAERSGRPVKMVMTYKDELMASNPSHPTVLTIRSGVKRDGTIVARTMRTVHASGAYGALKPNAALSTWHYVGGAYRVENASWEFLQVYTNTVPGGYFRAPGAHQYTFAVECHTDLIAKELGIDPAAYRLQTLLSDGEIDAAGSHLERIKARAVLQAALDAADWGAPKPGPNWGRGIGIFGRQIGGGLSGVHLSAHPDGGITVISPTVDQGVGTHTILRQLVAEDLQVPIEHVRVVIGDTDTAPFDEGPRASRVTYTEGTAVIKACEKLREVLLPTAASLLGRPEAEVHWEDGAFVSRDGRLSLTQAVVRAGRGEPVRVTVAEDAPRREECTYFCAQIAEVEVDPETGQVKLHRLITAHDVGTVINPITHQGQIDGGVMTGIGLALTEELLMDEADGRVTNVHLGEYKLPTTGEMPELKTVLVASEGAVGPYGASAVGEMANNSPPAAIANAIADAVDARVFELPVTAERVYRALKNQA